MYSKLKLDPIFDTRK